MRPVYNSYNTPFTGLKKIDSMRTVTSALILTSMLAPTIPLMSKKNIPAVQPISKSIDSTINLNIEEVSHIEPEDGTVVCGYYHPDLINNFKR